MELKERNAKIMALVNSGHTYQQAADSVGVTRNTVAGVVYRERRVVDDFIDGVIGKIDKPLIIKTHRKGMFGRLADWVMGRT